MRLSLYVGLPGEILNMLSKLLQKQNYEWCLSWYIIAWILYTKLNRKEIGTWVSHASGVGLAHVVLYFTLAICSDLKRPKDWLLL